MCDTLLSAAKGMTWGRFGAAESQTTDRGVGSGIPTRFDMAMPQISQMMVDNGLEFERAVAISHTSNYFRETYYYPEYGLEDDRFIGDLVHALDERLLFGADGPPAWLGLGRVVHENRVDLPVLGHRSLWPPVVDA